MVTIYAVDWEKIGYKLGLQEHHIDIITKDNSFNPSRTINSCTEMFKKWLKFDVSPTWDKVDAAIKAVTSDTKGLSFNHKGELYACI